jgi:hypothetical protein
VETALMKLRLSIDRLRVAAFATTPAAPCAAARSPRSRGFSCDPRNRALVTGDDPTRLPEHC